MSFPRGEEQVAFIGRPDRRRQVHPYDVVEGQLVAGGRPINRGGYYPALLIIPAYYSASRQYYEVIPRLSLLIKARLIPPSGIFVLFYQCIRHNPRGQ